MKNPRLFGILGLLAGLAHNPVTAGTVFAIDPTSQTIVEFDATTGTALGSIPTPEPASGGPDGLTASESTLFFVNAMGSNLVHEVDRATGAGVDAFPAPLLGGGTDGLAYMDGLLYTLDPAADTISKVDLATGQVVGSCSTGLFAVGGLAGEDGRLFATIGLTSIVEVDPTTCAVVGGPFATPDGDFVLGLAFDGTWLYAATYIDPKILTLDPSTGAVVSWFRPGFSASGLAAARATVDPTLPAALDVKPGSCPNPLNPRSLGVFPAAILGTETFDVGQVDLGTVRLEGVAPHRSLYQDRGLPGRCGPAADGVLDLLLHFDTQQVVAALRNRGVPLPAGARVTLRIEGRLTDGRLFTGEDAVTIVPGKGGR